MDLYSGIPYWIAKNPMFGYYRPLERDHFAEVVIIGSGITGALTAHELSRAGISCTLIDKRGIANGSSTASTALLQYEIDTPLSKLADMLDENSAVAAYRSSLQAITDIQQVFESIGFDPGYQRVPSLYYASNRKGCRLLKKEERIRKKHGLPVTYLDRHRLFEEYGIKAPAALENKVSAQMDPYDGAAALISYHMERSGLTVFSHTEVADWKETSDGYLLETDRGHTIRCSYLIVAAGFEAGKFLPQKVMKLTSTYAIISQPVDRNDIWPGRSLIWETREPYLYIRTTEDYRILVGGEDENFRNPVLRDKLLRKKVDTLEKKFAKLFPHIPFKTDMAWCGTFSSTDDGLPFIGNWPGKERMFYALGYGGNGITFSMIAAQLIRNKLRGVADDREKIFGFERVKKFSGKK